MFWFVFIRCQETGDFTAAAVVFSLGTNSETCSTKLLFMVLYKDTVQGIVQRYLECDAKVVPGDTVQGIVQRYLECDAKVVPGSRFSKNLSKKLRDIKKRAITVWVMLITIGIAYILRPLILPGRHFTEDLYVIYGLEPMVATPNYEIASTFMSITIITGVYILAGVTALILVIIGYIEAQILTLSDEMLTLWGDAEEYYHMNIETNGSSSQVNSDDLKAQIMNKFIKNRLKEITTFHILDINLLNDFETVFRVTMAIEFGLIVVGIISELLGGVENTYLELPYTFLQIFMDCYIGQKLIDAGSVFEKAVYDCKWENFDKANMKTVSIMLQASQKSLSLTAGGLVTLDFVCLMSVIKSTYSVYTTLQSTVSEI
ncbi:jg12257 [Pararge aegeria aegeria]|uniref:Odorant receptor n=1 Tax=Pararge aegeria aegeria TaxID=348720 RepID=A0A8S4S2Z3_9NEOP|nr:jg12257 [Pararge aegeria aegeria]